GIVGPNGAGKPTLLSLFAGSPRPDGGSVLFRGADITSKGAASRCRLGIARAYQVPKPFGGMTVFENVLVGASTGGGSRRRDAYRRVAEVLDLCEMTAVANRPAESLGVRHGLLQAVRQVSFEVAEGETLALVGANGAGKTTLLRAIAGAHRPAGGRISFEGRDITSLAAHRRVKRGIALVPEGRRL